MQSLHQEIEVRFLEIDKDEIIKKLYELKAEDEGEFFLREIIYSDSGLTWSSQGKLVRLRDDGKTITLSYKHHTENSLQGAEEIEIKVSDFEKAKLFLQKAGLVALREQEKKRHTFKLETATIDIDTWPSMPAYIEIEGESEEKLKEVAKLLNLDWGKAIFENAKIVIEKYYDISVSQLKFFTFSKIE